MSLHKYFVHAKPLLSVPQEMIDKLEEAIKEELGSNGIELVEGDSGFFDAIFRQYRATGYDVRHVIKMIKTEINRRNAENNIVEKEKETSTHGNC